MRNKEVFELVLTSIFVALIFLLGFVPNIGFITIIPGNPITILHIPVLIAAIVLSTKYAFIPGAAFGVVSLLQALLNPIGLNVAFINPIVSIVPRILFAVVVHYLFKVTKLVDRIKYGNEILVGIVLLVTILAIYNGSFYIFSNLDQVTVNIIAIVLILLFTGLYGYLYYKNDFKTLVVPSVFILGTIIHTIFVLSFVGFFETDLLQSFIPDQSVLEIIFFIAGFNGLMEALVAALIGTPIMLALKALPLMDERLN